MTTAPGDADDAADAGAPGAADASRSADRDPAAVVDAIEKPVLLFDGVCNLCNALVRFAVRFDAEGRFLLAPLQSDVGRELLRRHGRDTDDFDTMVLVEDGECYDRSTAVLRTARYLDGPLPLLYPLVFLPKGLRDRVYDFVAANRYRVFGKKDECPVPEPELRERFANRTLE